MICPLISNYGTPHYGLQECLKEKCAWWVGSYTLKDKTKRTSERKTIDDCVARAVVKFLGEK